MTVDFKDREIHRMAGLLTQREKELHETINENVRLKMEMVELQKKTENNKPDEARISLFNYPDIVGDVGKFHAACDTLDPKEPFIPDLKVRDLRWRLIDEEVNCELKDAMEQEDIVAIADAIADSIYVLVGTALAYGIPLNEVWWEVQRSNMAKVNPDTGNVVKREDGKIMKPQGWNPPNITRILINSLVKKASA